MSDPREGHGGDPAAVGLRVLTINLFGPEHADYERRRPVLLDGLRELRPDVVALQETVWGHGYDQAADLLGPEYQVAGRPGPSADGVGAAMASRWPLGTVRQLDLHVTGRTADLPWCAALVVEVWRPRRWGR